MPLNSLPSLLRKGRDLLVFLPFKIVIPSGEFIQVFIVNEPVVKSGKVA
jgi:hypothetical protein